MFEAQVISWTQTVLTLKDRMIAHDAEVAVPAWLASRPGLFGSLCLIADEYGYEGVEAPRNAPGADLYYVGDSHHLFRKVRGA